MLHEGDEGKTGWMGESDGPCDMYQNYNEIDA